MRILKPFCIRHVSRPSISRPRPTLRSFIRTAVARDQVSLPLSTGPLKLRDYQEECIQAVLTNIEEGHRRMGVSLATGSGKTVIFTQLISRIRPTTPGAEQTLILVHRRELVEQAARQCIAHYPDKTIEIEMGDSHATGVADITVASIRSVVSGDRITKFCRSRFKLVLIDEVHHAVSATYMKTLDHFGILDPEKEETKSTPILVGVSATMSRNDGLRLGKVLDRIVYHKDCMEMMNDKWLSPVSFTTIKSNVDLSEVGIASDGDFRLGQLGKAVNTNEANEITVRSWLERAADRRSTLVFCVDLAHVDQIVAKFRNYGVDARPITSNTSKAERHKRLEQFKAGEYKVLVNCGIFTEGTDIPNIDCILLTRPTRSKNLMLQMLGRGMRLHPGKECCHVIDMVGSIKRGIITSPTLFGLDPGEIVTNMSAEEMKERAEKYAEERLLHSQNEASRVKDITVTDYDNIYDLLGDVSDDINIRQLSHLAWIPIYKGTYVLEWPTAALKIQQMEDGTFDVAETRKIPRELAGDQRIFCRPRTIIEGATDLDMAIRGADTYAIKRYPVPLLLSSAMWRRGPATEHQIKYLEKLKGLEGEGWKEGLTKGKAGDMITRMKNGVLGMWEDLQKMKMRREKQLAKEKAAEEKMREKETVKVGSLTA